MTQQELADAAGVDIKTIGNLESRGRWPIARTRARIEKALGWEPGELQRIAESEPKEPEIPPTLMATIRRTLPPDDQARVIEAIRQTLSGDRSAGEEEESGHSARRAG